MTDDVAIADTWARARRLYPRSTSFQRCYVRGWAAARAGVPIDSCPYRRDDKKTWRAAWRAAWIGGHRSHP